jgi:hypothetical protein
MRGYRDADHQMTLEASAALEGLTSEKIHEADGSSRRCLSAWNGRRMATCGKWSLWRFSRIRMFARCGGSRESTDRTKFGRDAE